MEKGVDTFFGGNQEMYLDCFMPDTFLSLRAQRGNLMTLAAGPGDCRVTAFLAMTGNILHLHRACKALLQSEIMVSQWKSDSIDFIVYGFPVSRE